ncbi:MAG: hypothetical protein COU11_03840 [Candidatus Harrisonbacteria bacterium CG10_big_fil_rev_8_21_14_0_10_49_15]|uniref:Uncharacterized protein n=1 Tax=Candidatus Harrisonbacteria bacterium CG10_big_fil_rev_8_21_14_0_10_49_15 TaxID=1974587 RepID=A0A2H0UK84_9BACT|nr:MAG: hypothetical protein COU11_03840 [Candidatus Harrisonbacteria bacterium CG10_big_fil_rev_8_21_14_0_10_49_15]
MRKLIIGFAGVGCLLLPRLALAHCPLCTVGAGFAAVIATSLGVGGAAVGVFIGAFAVALGLWFSRLLKKEYVRYQALLLAVASFLLTVLPLLPIMEAGYFSWYISLGGEYGSLLNRTYIADMFLVGSIIGGVLVLVVPSVSGWVTKWRDGKRLPYQGVSLTFILLLIAAVLFELL